MKTKLIAYCFLNLLVVGCASVESDTYGGESPRFNQGTFVNEQYLDGGDNSTNAGRMRAVDESTSYASLSKEKGSAHAADIEQSKARTGAVLLAGAAIAGGAIVKGADIVGNKMNQIQAENYEFESKNRARGAYDCPACDDGEVRMTYTNILGHEAYGRRKCSKCGGTGWLLNGGPYKPF